MDDTDFFPLLHDDLSLDPNIKSNVFRAMKDIIQTLSSQLLRSILSDFRSHRKKYSLSSFRELSDRISDGSEHTLGSHLQIHSQSLLILFHTLSRISRDILRAPQINSESFCAYMLTIPPSINFKPAPAITEKALEDLSIIRSMRSTSFSPQIMLQRSDHRSKSRISWIQ